MALLVVSAWPAMAQTAERIPDIGLDSMAQRYQLGQGLALGDSGFTLGGYGEASYRDLHKAEGPDPSAAIDGLSAILWWDGGGRWRAFSELELENALVLQPGDTTAEDARLLLERFYVDYAARDALKFRVGKFLTPIGRWNLIHAAPLVWTTSRPLITETTFPTNATGAMLYGVLPGLFDGIEYSLYASIGEELFPEPGLNTFREAVGARVSASPLETLNLGLSIANFELENEPGQHRDLYGIDFAWTWRRWEVSGEVAARSSDNDTEDSRDERGLYLQLVAPLTQKLYAVTRYEQFHQLGADRDLKIYLGGINYRHRPAVVLKAEFVRALNNEGVERPDGLLASIAVLF